jgi:hypothetical protein
VATNSCFTISSENIPYFNRVVLGRGGQATAERVRVEGLEGQRSDPFGVSLHGLPEGLSPHGVPHPNLSTSVCGNELLSVGAPHGAEHMVLVSQTSVAGHRSGHIPKPNLQNNFIK